MPAESREGVSVGNMMGCELAKILQLLYLVVKYLEMS